MTTRLVSCAVHPGLSEGTRAAFACQAMLLSAGAILPPDDGREACALPGTPTLLPGAKELLPEVAQTAARWLLAENQGDERVAESCSLLLPRAQYTDPSPATVFLVFLLALGLFALGLMMSYEPPKKAAAPPARGPSPRSPTRGELVAEFARTPRGKIGRCCIGCSG